MGLYFEIILRNMKTKEEISEEHFSLKQFDVAWREALEVGILLANEWFEKDKYWYLAEVRDVTRR